MHATLHPMVHLQDPVIARQAAQWVGFRRSLRLEGRFSLLFGALAVVQGLSVLAGTALGWPLVALGVCLVAAGAWAARRPTPKAMRAELVAGWLVAGWNLLFGLLLLWVGRAGTPEVLTAAMFPLLLGGVQLPWALKALGRWRRCRRLAAPPAQAVAAMEALADQLAALRRADTPDTVEISTPGLGDSGRWRARLAERWALFVDREGRALALATPAEMEVVDRGERLLSHAHKATLRLGTRRIAGTMSADALARLQSWKAHAAALGRPPQPAAGRRASSQCDPAPRTSSVAMPRPQSSHTSGSSQPAALPR